MLTRVRSDESGNAALANLQKGLAPDGMGKQLGQLAANLAALETSLADIKQTMAAKPPATETAAALDKIKSASDAASDNKVLAAIDGLQQSLKTMPAAPNRTDLVVVHVAEPRTLAATSGAAAPIAPLSVQFRKIGGTDETAQTAVVVARLKDLLKGHQGCAVSVAGYADTLGPDDLNLEVSKDRAHVIAAKLKEALGSDVQIAETAWGERRLHEMTKDNVAAKANRRVDIAVQCKS